MASIERDGVHIHYEVLGNGPPLVLYHGLGGSLRSWYDVGYINKLKDDYQLVLVDARGHGRSDKPTDPADYAIQQQVLDIVSILDRQGIDKAHFFGFSLGGRVALGISKYAPDLSSR